MIFSIHNSSHSPMLHAFSVIVVHLPHTKKCIPFTNAARICFGRKKTRTYKQCDTCECVTTRKPVKQLNVGIDSCTRSSLLYEKRKKMFKLGVQIVIAFAWQSPASRLARTIFYFLHESIRMLSHVTHEECGKFFSLQTHFNCVLWIFSVAAVPCSRISICIRKWN